MAVVATKESEDVVPTRPDPNDILPDGLYRWKFKIERHLTGQESHSEIDVSGFQHTGFNHKIKHFLLFLRLKPDGSYERVALQHELVKDGNGRFVIPIAKPFPDEILEDSWSIPMSYRSLMRPIVYHAEDAWWLKGTYVGADDGMPIKAEDFPWGKVEGDQVVADRGVFASDLVKALSFRRCNAR